MIKTNYLVTTLRRLIVNITLPKDIQFIALTAEKWTTDCCYGASSRGEGTGKS